jgi:hypothetical protein
VFVDADFVNSFVFSIDIDIGVLVIVFGLRIFLSTEGDDEIELTDSDDGELCDFTKLVSVAVEYVFGDVTSVFVDDVACMLGVLFDCVILFKK